MSTGFDHPSNDAARAHRKSYPATNHFDLATLLDMPPYWGWVDHRAEPEAQPFCMFLGGNDDGVALRLFWNGRYESQTLALWSRLARTHAMALDIGAHTGIYTLAAHAANPSMSILSLEPNSMNYARLTLNLRANNLATTDSYMLGASDRDGTRPFTIRTNLDFHSSGGTFEPVTGGYVSPARIVALDSFLPPALADAVDLIKLDIEGHEATALAGMRAMIARARPTMIFECITDATAAAVSELMAPLGYRFYEIDDDAGTIRETTLLAPTLAAEGSPDPNRLNRIAVHEKATIAELSAI